MLLSVVVLSYNRPSQIERILKNLIGVTSKQLNLIIKDDQSPRQNEIIEIFERYKPLMNFEVNLHKNKTNLGYDKNLIDSFYITDSDYVYLLSDDDYLLGENIHLLVNALSKKEFSVYFTPYHDDEKTNRIQDEGYKLKNFHSIIYNSILFSGLVFNREKVISLSLDVDFLSNCIYSQVYLASIIIYKEESYGFIPEKILYLGGDGENYFGKNESAVNSELLSERSHITSNLNYQPFLLSVVNKISKDTDKVIYNLFLREYFKRLISYALTARSSGIGNFFRFVHTYYGSNLPFKSFTFLFYFPFFFIPAPIAKKINNLLVRKLRKAG